MSWEQRMSEKAAERREQRERRELAEWKAEHLGHHNHLRGTLVECSCGFVYGVTTVAVTWNTTPTCTECGLYGVWLLT